VERKHDRDEEATQDGERNRMETESKRQKEDDPRCAILLASFLICSSCCLTCFSRRSMRRTSASTFKARDESDRDEGAGEGGTSAVLPALTLRVDMLPWGDYSDLAMRFPGQ
jgi:hypothetical protein